MKTAKQIFSILLALTLSLAAAGCGTGAASAPASAHPSTVPTETADAGADFQTAAAEPAEESATGPAAVSNIGSVGGVPLIVLNNGVEVPQLGLGTQIQRLEGDSSESGRLLFHP